jgi:hypothetical protein
MTAILGLEDITYENTDMPFTHEERAFDVYQRYLVFYVKYLTEKYPNIETLIQSTRVILSKRFLKPEEISLIKHHLIIAWNTEYLCTYNDGRGTDSELLRVNNQWKPIQAYYSIYSILRSLLVCFGNISDSHSATLKIISEKFCSDKVFERLVPWSLGFKGYRGKPPNISSTFQPINFPHDIRIPNPLEEKNVLPIESIACCLRAEHDNRIEDYHPKKRAIHKYLKDPGATTVFHFLLRLRMKSNYESAEIFIARAPIRKVVSFSKNLSLLLRYTSTCLECLILNVVGKQIFLDIVQDYREINPQADGILKRVELYSKLF